MRKLIIAIMLALVTVVGVCLPALAAEPPPTPTDSPRHLWVCLNGNYAFSQVVDGVVVKDISVTCRGWGETYKLEIQRGTGVVLVPKGATVVDLVLLQVYVYRDNISIASNLFLSGKQAAVYKLVEGTWVKLGDLR